MRNPTVSRIFCKYPGGNTTSDGGIGEALWRNMTIVTRSAAAALASLAPGLVLIIFRVKGHAKTSVIRSSQARVSRTT